jgi:hypothetical protein
MVRLYSRSVDDGSGTFDVRRGVAGGDRNAERHEVLGARQVGVTPRDRNSAAAGDQRQPAHAGAANPHEVDRASIRGIEQCHYE